MSKKELDAFRDKMPETKQGVEFTHNGKTYVAAIRRLTPTECDRLQGVPEWYNWGGKRLSALQNGRQWLADRYNPSLLVVSA